MIFKKHKRDIDKVEQRRTTAIALVHDLSKADKERLLAGMELAWQADEKFRKVQTREEKELADIEEAEKTADYIEEVGDAR